MQQLTVETMARALGLPPVAAQQQPSRPLPRRKASTSATPSPKIFVRLSVRNGGGLPICYKKTVAGISTLQAEIDVKKMARAEGYVVWATLEVSVVRTVQ